MDYSDISIFFFTLQSYALVFACMFLVAPLLTSGATYLVTMGVCVYICVCV